MTVRRISKIQKQFWILNEIYPHSGAYNLYSVFRLSEPLNYEYLQRAVRTVIGRHEPLRTSFELIDNELSQSIRTSDETDFSINEVKINENYVEDVVHTEIINEVNRPFDLSKSPIFRFSIFSFKNHVSVLSLVFHHIIIDVRSEGIFAKELSEVYNSLVEKREMKLEAVRFQYSDYIDEISSWYASDQYLEKLKELELDCPDPDTVIKLPEDRINDGNVSNDGSGVYFSIEKQFSDKIKQFTEKNNINAYRVFLAAYAILLYRLSNQEKISIGLPLTNRTRPVSKSTFGCFINALPLLVDFSDDKSSKVVLENVSGSLTRLLDRQEVPFTDLVIHSRHESNTTVNPYFQTGFAFKPPMQLEIDNIEARPLKIIHRENQNEFDLLLTLYPEDDGFTGYARYSAQLFRGETVNKWIELYKKIVNQLIEYPESSVNKIDIVSDEDKKRLNEFNRTEVAIPECLLQNFFEQQAGMRPEKTAIISEEISHSYRELEERSNQLANYLGSLGVKQGDIVGVCLERSFEMVVSVLGVLKAGCCYLPMDPSFPDERISYMYEDSGAKVLISQSSLRDKLGHFTGATIVLTDLDRDRIGGNSSEKPEIIIDNQSLAYIIYTSGSTGKPKGVKVPHEGVVNLIGSMTRAPGIKADDNLLAVVTLSFDMSVYELFVPLSAGATVVVATSRDTTDGQALIGLMDKYNITMLQATPSLWNILLSSGWQGKKDLRAFCGGEALTRNMVREMLPRVSEFWNCYGPTETTVYSAIKKVTDAEAPIVIGKPIENTRIYILDKNGNQVPVGVTGEVCIGGRGITKGYNNLPELTEEKFIRFENGDVIYKTGDLGRYLADGTIELFGRSDNQIKLRGFRIEPGEIESLLSQLPGVKEAVVKIHRFDEHDQRLVAFLNVTGEFRLSREEMTESLSHRLPGYMIPSFFQTSDGFPRLPNGKINKKALILEIDEPEKKQELAFESLTKTQKRILNIWEDILKIKNISASVNFFDAGGNSLLVIRMLNKIREDLGFTMTFKEFMAHPAIVQSGNYIDSQSHVVSEGGIDLIHLRGTTNLPLTLNQKRIWLISKLQPDISSYIIPFTFKLSGTLERDIFQKSLDMLFHRHHIVYSIIKEVEEEPCCDIVESDPYISYTDYSGLAENERLEKVNEIFRSDSGRAFDLHSGPLYRLYLIKTGKEEYYFRISIHHIVFDGWSWGVLVKDLNEIYNSLIRGKEAVLEDIEFQQYDYAEWENSPAGLVHGNESIEFWKENLQGATPVLNFPYDYQRSDKPTGRAGYETIRLSEDLSEKLRRISKEEGSTLFATMLSAFGILMQKYTGEDDLNIGLPIAYRPHSKLENIFGMFVNTVVVRLRYEKGNTFKDIIHRTSEAALNAIAHQDLPFEKVVEIVNPERSTNINPLFQVGFDWQNNLGEQIKLDNLRSESITSPERTTIFDITLYVWENGSHIEGEIEYNFDILRSDTITILKDNFIKLLYNLADNCDTPIDSLLVISDKEREMIDVVNDTFADYSGEKTILRLFEERAFADPKKTALISDNGMLTYSEVNVKATRLAAVLQTYNIGPGDFVGLLIRRSPELIICLLAIFKCGAAYVPLNLSDPDNRVISIIDTAKIKFVITNNDNNLNLAGRCHQHNIEDLIKQSVLPGVEYNDITTKSSDHAYVIYTSGTTGTPKGVLVNHKSVINLIEWVNRTFEVTYSDKLLWVTNLSFDLSVYDIFGILAAGAIIRIINEEDRQDPEKQHNILINEGITFWDSAPQSLQQLTPYFKSNGDNSLKNSLRLVFLSGDWIPLSLPATITSSFPLAVVVGLGGATEATIWSNYFIIDKINPDWKSIPYGKPIQNARYYILDEKLNHCRIKQPGNLYIGGDCLALGYFNDSVLTDAKFIPDPYNPGSKLYLTGDKAQWMPDGNIEFLGREDEQLKVRGYRVEIGEIKNAVLQNKKIKDAIVIPDKSDRHNIKVILFITTFDDIKLEIKDLKKEMRESLPEYMIPPDIIQCSEFPATANGKTDTKALLALYIKSVNENQKKIPEGNEGRELSHMTTTGRIIKRIWCEALLKEEISATDNFFDAGGNSLLAIRVLNRIKEKFGFTMSFKTFIGNPTIIQLANLIKSQSGIEEEAIKLVHLTGTTNLPLTSNQKRLWLISKLEPDLPSYIISFTYKFIGSLQTELFQRSLNILFRRHLIVFSIIKEADNGEPYCDIIPSEADISFHDYSELSENIRSANVNTLLQADSMKVFDLRNGPLYRLYLIKTAKDEYYFRVSIHHIIFDAWSWSVFAKDLNDIYNSLLRGSDLNLEEIYFQQYDFAQWEKNAVVSGNGNKSIEFWKDNLEEASAILNFPYDFQRTDVPSGRGSFEAIQLSEVLSDKLRRISKNENSSLFATLLSVFGIQLQKYSGEDDINIGLPVAYRPHSKLENIFGMFVNTVVVRLRYEKELSLTEIIHRTNDAALNAIAHQETPFEKIVEVVNPERTSFANPLFQVGFVWQHNQDIPVNLDNIRSEKVTVNTRTSIFDLTLYLWENGNNIEGEIEYNLDLLTTESVIRLRDNFIHLAQSLADNTDQILSEISIISDNDKALLSEFNKTEAAIPGFLIQSFFENRAQSVPSGTAVISAGKKLSYRELDDQSNQLANHLISMGVIPGDIIGVSMERSVDMIVSVLGVLKTGCCYLPMDPSFPEDRIRYMYEDSGARFLITESLLKDKFNHLPGTSVVMMDTDNARIGRSGTGRPELDKNTQSLAYIIYTSGSTGKPKGVKVHHQAVVNLIASMSKEPGVKENDILLAVVTLSFDMSVFELFVPLSNGATIVVANSRDTTDGQSLMNLIDEYNITMLQATPSLWNLLLANGWKGKSDLRAFCGGEALSRNLIRQILPKVSEFWNCYGPTETTVYSTFTRVTDAEATILIGKPLNNTRIYILDMNHRQLPVGVIGEVCIGGLGVTKGYNNRPDLTAEKFISFENGQTIYKTGDLGRFLVDGNIELFGRIDNQIKLRGFRIEPGEIENLLSLLPGVNEAVVKIHKFNENDERLVAFINTDAEFKLTDEEITGYLSQHVPAYMIPSFIQKSDGFPRLPNGKINKKALILEIDESDIEPEIDFDSLTATQKKLSSIWKDVLKIRDIPYLRNFFDIGGNSLLVIRILNKIKEELGFSMSFKDFIAYPTIIESGNYVDSQTQTVDNGINLVHLTGTTNLPLTLNQKRIWLISKLQPDIPSYIIPFTDKLSGPLNLEIFQKSIDILFQRHYILFSVIKEVKGEPVCNILLSRVNISFTDYSGLPETEKSEKVRDIFRTDSGEVFDLEKGPLYRLYLIRTGAEEYYFRISIHHIVFDGWSWGVLVKDLNEIYNSLLRGKEIVLDKIEFQLYDYANWERGEAGSKHGDESKGFWKEYLQGASSILNFPYDFPRKDQPTGRASYVTLQLSRELTEKLRNISKKENSSLFATMLSAFGLQMQKYTGEEDINIGLPVAYRPHSKLENIIGMFVNTVVVRLKNEEGLSFSDIIHRTNEAALIAIAHQDLPFEKIVEIVNPKRSTRVNPLFQVALDWQNNLEEQLKLDNVSCESISPSERTTIFDITFYLWEHDGQIIGDIEYNMDILRRDTIVRFKDNFINLLHCVIENPEKAVSEISLISETDMNMLSQFNQTEILIPDCSIQNSFENQVTINPLKTAVISAERSITYQKLDDESNQLANYLLRLGVRPGDIVGVCIERSVDMIISVLGVLKAGCCYLPMDPSFPEDRIRYMYEDSGARFLITESPLKNKFSNLPGTSVVVTDTDNARIGRSGTGRTELNISTQSLAYIIYTSGSTGKPKGVKVHHQAVVNLIASMSKEPGVKENDILLAVVTLSFDMSVFELFVPLSNGATVVVASSRDTTDGQSLMNLIDEYNITMLQATPSLWNILLASGWKGKRDLRAFCGGEALTRNLLRQILPNVSEFWNCYGPTETTVYSTILKITDSEAPILIGKPINNTRIYILDKNSNPVPIGVVGEVCIGGLGVTKGYNNKPELTAEKFIRYEKDEIIYKTGDLGRFLTDGNIELFGRMDNQIKLRGFRIEPGEIESLLSQLKGVKEAVVKIHKFEEKDERLVAFLNVDPEFKMNSDEITSSLSQNLPGYMIPFFFQTSDGFPRLPNGKIDKNALLLEIDESDIEQEIDFDSLTATQKKLSSIWKDVLKIRDIPYLRNFFDIGGNSLLVIRILNKIKEELGFSMSFKDFIAYPTIIESGNYVDSQTQTVDNGINLVHLTGTTNLPLTLNQKRIWLISKLQPDIPSYIIPFTDKLSGPLNLEIFQKSIDILFKRHYILFSIIKEVKGEPVCNILLSGVNIAFTDYSGLPETEKSEKVRDIFRTDSGEVFDLENGPLYRLYLIRTGAEEYYFRISIHHIVFDGWSWGVLVKDLNEIYNSLLRGKEIVLDKIEFQLYDYANWERGEAGSKHGDESKGFWKEYLQGASSILNFPYDFPRKDQPTGRASYVTLQLSRELTEKLRNISKKENSSLFATMLSAFGLQMQKYTGEEDINIGLPVAYRPHSKLENIIGMFVNTVVARIRNDKGFTFRDIIHRTNEVTLNAIAHQDLPFEKVVEIVNPNRTSNTNPLFQVAFAWQNNLDEPIKLEGVRSEKISLNERSTIFNITFYMWENGNHIEGEIEYNVDVIRQDTIVRLRDNLLILVNNLVENLSTPVELLSMISDQEKKMIDSFNNTKTSYPKDKTIVQLFEEMVSRYPDKTAIVFKGSTLTYSQLNERTNQLARTLRYSGVRENTPVGILAEKSLEVIVGILGILKAGGAYLPIDPEYPEQRISFIIKDSACRILVTQDKFMESRIEGVLKINLNSRESYNKKKSDIENINNPSDLAYVMYTSGTTGLPKGSMISQNGVVRLVRNTNYIEMTSEDRILLTGAIVFDATTFEIWGALLNGGTLFIAEKETILNPKALGAELDRNDITILWLTSALFTQIAEARTDIFRKLKYLLSGGDVLSAAHINKVRKDNPSLKVINGYGPTENTTFSTTYEIDKDYINNIPIGKPISNSSTYIFDKNMNYQPIGVIGELYVGGDGVSLGYINREDLNNKSFIDHPYIPGERLYKTGDYARWLPDGNIEFHGRMDNQLKIRGFRVELGEIESVISEIDGVIETVIKPIKVGEGDTRLIAFLNISDSFSMDTRAIRNQIKEKLPPYMIPSAFKFMNGFPKTINGKIDKDALKIDVNEIVKREIRDVNSFTPSEKIIYEIWCEALKTNDISPTDNFFEVGGNSLMAISVFSKIESAFNIDLGLRVFFDSPRIDAMAEVIDLSILKTSENKPSIKPTGKGARIIEGEI